jgi:hypothetical protein
MRPLAALLLSIALPLAAQPPGTVKPTIAHTITLNAYADNWCAIFINGKLVAADSIDFLPHNQVSVKILPEYPLTIAVLAKDNADPATGLEYGDKIGDAGFILKLGDGTVTNGTWKAKSFFTGPLNSNIANPTVSRTDLPARWYAVDFDDSAWGFATEYASERVGPDGDYVAGDFTNAKFIWTSDLNLDNTVVLRTTVQKPAGFVKRWTTTPELDVSQLPAELLPVTAASGTAGQFANLATRAQIGEGENALIPGFVLTGTTPRTVLVRAVGPGLKPYGVAGAVADPTLAVYRGAALIANNDNWQDQLNASAVSSAAVQTGAFALATGSKDSALVLTLEPGSYTFQVAGVGQSTGVALVEAYILP